MLWRMGQPGWMLVIYVSGMYLQFILSSLHAIDILGDYVVVTLLVAIQYMHMHV